MKHFARLSWVPVFAWVVAGAVCAQTLPELTGFDYPILGQVKPRHAREIVTSSWSVGCETLDRDFADYHAYKQYLGPLGAKSMRLQAGWAKCEKEPGVYNWNWLDSVVNDALSQGLQPWVELSYGNPVYPGGGGIGLGGGFPSSPEALAGWDRWARALVERYSDRVHEWEIWNEPDINSTGTAPVEGYVGLFIRTATMIRELQPDGRIYALALAHNVSYAEQFLDAMQARGKLGLIDALTFHSYPNNPDDTRLADQLRKAIAKTGQKIALRQGETGAPSRYQENFALRDIAWTENLQAKWNLRRMLAHHAKSIPFNLFTIADMRYHWSDLKIQMNYKGLLETRPDKSILRPKLAYFAAQSVFSIFDDRLEPMQDCPAKHTSLRQLAMHAYRDREGRQLVAYWFNDAPPAQANGVSLISLTLSQAAFKRPVLVDLRSSTVYQIPPASWSKGTNGFTFLSLPVYDSPMLLAESGLVPVEVRQTEKD